ncbi:hypothetical protein EVAR_45774_1 [Eumeta japonica]|uniref:Uncharacterized protein n=1 Tax=Eumeta variegata TaxID=151549 RepID=A0A4C1X3R9_EUMVA|nr:hypothetical protein EVAR_45774_1 [Eumeta japonica]
MMCFYANGPWSPTGGPSGPLAGPCGASCGPCPVPCAACPGAGGPSALGPRHGVCDFSCGPVGACGPCCGPRPPCFGRTAKVEAHAQSASSTERRGGSAPSFQR